MAGYNKFEDFVVQLCSGVHQLHTAGHQLEVYLSDEQPLAADTVKTDIAEITIENGYTGPADIANDVDESPAGTARLLGSDKQWTATAGGFGTLQFAVLFNQDAASPLDALIAWWDYGSSITVNDGESFTVDFGTPIFTLA